MIKMPHPSMALNASGVPGAHYQMYNSWEVPATETPQHILNWVATVAHGAPGGRLAALIINCHGLYGKGADGLSVGGFGLKLGTGIAVQHAALFATVAGKVQSIWITACGTARISGNPAGNGHAFCGAMARSAQATVFAATTHQVGDSSLPFGYIDSFEGLVVKYNAKGAIAWSHNYGRGMLEGLRNGWD